MSWNVGYRKMNRKRNEEKRRARECPFCGSLEVRMVWSPGDVIAWAECRNCWARGPQVFVPEDHPDVQAEVMEAWNGRKEAQGDEEPVL